MYAMYVGYCSRLNSRMNFLDATSPAVPSTEDDAINAN